MATEAENTHTQTHTQEHKHTHTQIRAHRNTSTHKGHSRWPTQLWTVAANLEEKKQAVSCLQRPERKETEKGQLI